MLLAINIDDIPNINWEFLNQLFQRFKLECSICYNDIENYGWVGINKSGIASIDKIYCQSCYSAMPRDYQSKTSIKLKDHHRRNIEIYHKFPPKDEDEAKQFISRAKVVIGHDELCKEYSDKIKNKTKSRCIDKNFKISL